jgi:hypothetical protein
MHVNDVLGIFGALIMLAIFALALRSPNTSKIIQSITQGFAHDVSAAGNA